MLDQGGSRVAIRYNPTAMSNALQSAQACNIFYHCKDELRSVLRSTLCILWEAHSDRIVRYRTTKRLKHKSGTGYYSYSWIPLYRIEHPHADKLSVQVSCTGSLICGVL